MFGQNPLKDVDPRLFTRMLRKDDGWTEGRTEGRTKGWKDGRTDGSATISLRNFVGEGITKQQWTIEEISIFSNSSHLEWRAELSDTILK